MQNSQQRFPAPRGNKNHNQGGADDELQGTNPDSELQQHQGGSLMPIVGTQRYQKHDANSGKVSELRIRSTLEWERIERVTLEKLEEIKAERLIQMERVIETFNLDTAYKCRVFTNYHRSLQKIQRNW